MPRRSVQTWKTEHIEDGLDSLYVYGLDYEGNSVVEFVFDSHMNIRGEKHYADVKVTCESKIRPLPIILRSNDGTTNKVEVA
jgi:hypothetical protein